MIKRMSFCLLLVKASACFSQVEPSIEFQKGSDAFTRSAVNIENPTTVTYGYSQQKANLPPSHPVWRDSLLIQTLKASFPDLVRKEFRMIPYGKNSLQVG